MKLFSKLDTMIHNKIKHPLNKFFYNINGKIGKSLLNKYLVGGVFSDYYTN